MSVLDIANHWGGRPVFAVIDLDQLATNIRVLRNHLAPGVKFCSVVKANAYGHGAVPVAKTEIEAGVDLVAVATVDEGEELRLAGITHPILSMGPIGAGEIRKAVDLQLELVLNDPSFTSGLAAVVRESGHHEPLKVHLKVDTGMHRFGVMPNDVVAVARKIQSYPELKLEGLMTHMASADEPDTGSALEQVRVFDACVRMLDEAGIEIPLHHVGNSAMTVQFPEHHKTMTRSGLSTFGVRPAPHIPLPGAEGEMKPILTLHGMVVRVIPLKAGESISYGATWTAPVDTRAALVPLGYADSYMRSLSNAGWMSIKGERCPVVGRVCMDQTMVRLPDSLQVKNRDRVVIIGDGTPEMGAAPTIEELAKVAGTIPHEIFTGFPKRLPKIYVKQGDVFAVEDLSGYREMQSTYPTGAW